VPVYVFDGVLHGDDMLLRALVNVVNHGGEGGGLAAARGPGYQHQPPGQGSQAL
jgi:hypothetical protein